ncbi:MAG: hypothetical protein IPJ40_11250 [Saprospirales bacterium]|nr:hypothetical protein [Saprospirales bacterium]
MKPYQVNIINALVLLVIGLWGYVHPEAQRSFALIPVAFGALFLGTTPLFRNGNRIVAYLVSGLTLLLALALAGFLVEALNYHDPCNIFRFGIMALSSIGAAGVYLKTYLVQRAKSS